MNAETTSPDSGLWTSVALLLGVYALLLVLACWNGAPEFKGSDSYSRIAEELLRTGSITSTFRPPLYAALLALVMKVFGDSWVMAALVLQSLIGVACGVLIVALTSRLVGPKAAGIALALYASHLLLHFEALAKRETALYTLGLLAFVSVCVRDRGGAGRYPLLGVLAALLHLARPNGIFFLLPLAALVVFEGVQGKRSARVIAGQLTLAVALCALVLFPWQLRMRAVTGKFTLASSTTSGMNLWKGNNPYLGSFVPWIDVDDYEPWARREANGRDIFTFEGDRELVERAKEHIRRAPRSFFAGAFVKVANLFSPVPSPWGRGALEEGGEGPLRVAAFTLQSKATLITGTLHGTLLLVGVLLALFDPRFRKLDWRFLVTAGCVVGTAAAISAVTFSELRFRLPLDTLFIVVAAAGYSWKASRMLGRARFIDAPLSAFGRSSAHGSTIDHPRALVNRSDPW